MHFTAITIAAIFSTAVAVPTNVTQSRSFSRTEIKNGTIVSQNATISQNGTVISQNATIAQNGTYTISYTQTGSAQAGFSTLIGKDHGHGDRGHGAHHDDRELDDHKHDDHEHDDHEYYGHKHHDHEHDDHEYYQHEYNDYEGDDHEHDVLELDSHAYAEPYAVSEESCGYDEPQASYGYYVPEHLYDDHQCELSRCLSHLSHLTPFSECKRSLGYPTDADENLLFCFNHAIQTFGPYLPEFCDTCSPLRYNSDEEDEDVYNQFDRVPDTPDFGIVKVDVEIEDVTPGLDAIFGLDDFFDEDNQWR